MFQYNLEFTSVHAMSIVCHVHVCVNDTGLFYNKPLHFKNVKCDIRG